jgi:hypothetical protein
VEKQPWKSLLEWMRTAASPFLEGRGSYAAVASWGSWTAISFKALTLSIPAFGFWLFLPDNWEIVRQSALSANNTSTPTPSNRVNRSPTTPRPAGPGGITSRNPFSSPLRRQDFSSLKTASPPRSTTVESDAVPPIASSGRSRHFHADG